MRSFPDLGVFGEQAGGVLLDDLAVVFDAELQLSCAMLVEHGAHGLRGLLVLACRLFELDGLALAA